MGVIWFGEDHGANTIKDTCIKEIRLHPRILLTTLHSIVNTTGRTYVFSSSINKCALPITITKSGGI
jgi:hypothetical protein